LEVARVGLRRKPTQATADTQVKTVVETADTGELAQPLRDRSQCEFIVVDLGFRITQYHSPRARYDELLEQRAVGQHCFEVSHGRDSPCASPDCECPVTKVLEADAQVVVRHHHKSQFERWGLSAEVEVVATPIRDSNGSITHIAQLIYEAANS